MQNNIVLFIKHIMKYNNMKINFIEWWLFDSGFSITFFSKAHLSQLTRYHSFLQYSWFYLGNINKPLAALGEQQSVQHIIQVSR